MHERLIGFSAAILAVAVFGCGSSSGNQSYVCSYPASVGICYEWTAPNALTSAQLTQLQQACSSGQLGGMFSTGGQCPSASRVGTCAITNVGIQGVSYKWSFYSPIYNAQTGQTFCTNYGAWTPG